MPEATYRRALCWIRRDLRLSDHTALAEAAAAAAEVIVAFVYDRPILDALADPDDRRLTFISRSLDELDSGLRSLGSHLVTLQGDPVDLIPRLAEHTGSEAVFASHDDDPYALERDTRVAGALAKDGRSFHSHKDCVVFERREVLSQTGAPFRVFTPYSRAWRALLTPEAVAERISDLARLARAPIPLPGWAYPGNLPLAEVGFRPADLWLEPGETAAHARLRTFATHGLTEYKDRRDFPGEEGTSGLSVHLRHGTVSVRECFRTALAVEGKGAAKWLDELVWREFYHMVLANFPHVVETTFREEYADIEWPGTDGHHDAWENGQTGYPFVDAAMRCFKATGWMHNRLRMVTAMFLTKDLLVDYRRGEAYFARTLLDFELASNNGGWQWSASTGVDAQPYFRVFNPVLQSRKFDPDGSFIKRWCPELEGYDANSVHWPSATGPLEQIAAGCVVGERYPHPIVDHDVQRARAIALFKA